MSLVEGNRLLGKPLQTAISSQVKMNDLPNVKRIALMSGQLATVDFIGSGCRQQGAAARAEFKGDV
jgi:hypothetical protein